MNGIRHGKGYRGYIGSRPYNGDRVPQHVQNLVIRDYCKRMGYHYLLSATEYAMDSCYMMLEEVLREAPELDGIVLYSLAMLPKNKARRDEILHRFLSFDCSIHGALESQSVRNATDIERISDLWRVQTFQATSEK